MTKHRTLFHVLLPAVLGMALPGVSGFQKAMADPAGCNHRRYGGL